MRQRLIVPLVLVAVLAGYAAPAAAATKPTKGQAAAIVKGLVYTRQTAQVRADRLITLALVPGSATRHSGIYAPGTLSPGVIDADHYTAYTGRWWSVPGTIASVTTWFAEHPPVGFANYGSGRSPGSDLLLFQPVSAAAGCCSTIDVTVAKAGTHVTVSIAAFVQWQPKRGPIETIPPSVHTASVMIGTISLGYVPAFPQTDASLSGAALKPLVSMINALPPTRLEPIPCPLGPNSATVVFRYDGHVVSFASPDACPFVQVTVDGQASTTLAGNLTHAAATALGLTPIAPAM